MTTATNDIRDLLNRALEIADREAMARDFADDAWANVQYAIRDALVNVDEAEDA
jgi:hypothetical protein